MQTAIDYTVEFTINEGDEATFEALAKQCIEMTEQTEDGTLEYEWFLSDDGHVCQLHERFRDSDAMIEHLNSQVVSDVLPKLLEVSELTRFDVHGPTSPEGEKALAAFGTRNFRELAGFVR